jgi:hypothetical protein
LKVDKEEDNSNNSSRNSLQLYNELSNTNFDSELIRTDQESKTDSNFITKIRNESMVRVGTMFFRTSAFYKKPKFKEIENEQRLEKCELVVKTDPQYLVEYVYEIYQNLKDTEVNKLFIII